MTKRIWIWLGIAVAFFVLFLLPAAVTFWLYRENLGNISHKPDDWGAFGSLLSGIFTYIAAVGTMGTLIFLVYQQGKNNELINRQLALQTFEEYERHRKLFFEKLSEIESHYDNEIVFPQRERVYSSIFHMNSPSTMQYALNINEDNPNARPKDLIDCLHKYDKISEMLDDYQTFNNCISVIIETLDLSYDLGISAAKKNVEGQILWFDMPTALNINNIGLALERIERTLNTILFMSSNQPVKSIYHKAQSLLFRDYVLQHLSEHKRQFPVTIVGHN